MKAKIEARTTLGSVICNEPIILLKAINECSPFFEESRREMAAISDVIRNFMSCEQKDEEGLLENARRFKLSIDTVAPHTSGNIVLVKHAQEKPPHGRKCSTV